MTTDRVGVLIGDHLYTLRALAEDATVDPAQLLDLGALVADRA